MDPARSKGDDYFCGGRNHDFMIFFNFLLDIKILKIKKYYFYIFLNNKYFKK